jgi:hemoglobin-like flavoprotein
MQGNSGTAGELIAESLELAAARCEDLTPLVYDRLFAEKPETRAMFRADPKNLVKGSMLELALEAILDFAGEKKASHRLIFCEVQSHDAYGTQPEIFTVFFVVIRTSCASVSVLSGRPKSMQPGPRRSRSLMTM